MRMTSGFSGSGRTPRSRQDVLRHHDFRAGARGRRVAGARGASALEARRQEHRHGVGPGCGEPAWGTGGHALQRASRACGSAGRSCASAIFTRCSMTTSTDRAASRPVRCEGRRCAADTGSQLRDAYRRMKTIREFEERLHVEIATGRDSRIHAPVCRPGGGCSGCMRAA